MYCGEGCVIELNGGYLMKMFGVDKWYGLLQWCCYQCVYIGVIFVIEVDYICFFIYCQLIDIDCCIVLKVGFILSGIDNVIFVQYFLEQVIWVEYQYMLWIDKCCYQ